MSNNSTSNSNNNLYNICSLEHCYTNLFALTDITGIKWLRLCAKEKCHDGDNQSFVAKGKSKRKKACREDDDDEEDEEEGDDDSNDEAECDSDLASADKHASSSLLKTSSANDPVLSTHAKCLSEDILSSWKRADLPAAPKNMNSSAIVDEHFEETFVEQKSFKKELWIFWFEKEEPSSLRSIISNDLVVDHSNQNGHSHSQTSQSASDDNMLSHASSSLLSLPYECRSMLFKALHNLIEKSLLEKGYARLGKWFVMPYNLNSINFSICNQNVNSSAMFVNKESTKSKPKLEINSQIDDTNHVSYSFSFFLHGTSRVCTSVDIKMHKPVRLLNQSDLAELRTSVADLVGAKRHKTGAKKRLSKQEVILAPYGIAARLIGYLSNDTLEAKVTCNEWRQFYPLNLVAELPNVFVVGLDNNRVKLFYPNCFIYVVMDSDSDKSDDDEHNFRTLADTASESASDHSVHLNSMDSSSSDEERAHKNAFNKPAKQMDSLDLTIDSVARNFGADKDSPLPPPPPCNKSVLSISLNSPMSVNAVSSPASAQSPAQSPSVQQRRSSPAKNALKRQKSLLNRSSSVQVEPLPPPGHKSIKKRKKNLDSSSSDLSLNNSGLNAPPSPAKKQSAPKKSYSSDSDESVVACHAVVDQARQSDPDCCLVSYNLNKLFKNQIRLKHKKYELLSENLSLAFDVLDKVSLQSCTNLACGNGENFTCTRCCLGNGPASSAKCCCGGESGPVKSEPFTDQLNMSATKCVPFHKRKCYFGHKKPLPSHSFKAYAKFVKSFKLSDNHARLRQKVHFKHSTSDKLKVLRVKSDESLESDGEQSGSSTDSSKTDPDMFNYQYFEREEDDDHDHNDDDDQAESSVNSDSADTDSTTESESSSGDERHAQPSRQTKVKFVKQYLQNVTNQSRAGHTKMSDFDNRSDKKHVESDNEPCFDSLYAKCDLLYEEEAEANLIAKSSQMTPPKSVDSSQPSAHHHHNAVNVPPASYDDLNNIFEDESSADEQQSAQQQPVAQQQHVQLINPMQTGLSVVMTPPSHENIQKSNQQGHDDLSLNDPDLLLKRPVLPTKKIAYNNLNTLMQIQNFGCMFAEQQLRLPPLRADAAAHKYKPVAVAAAESSVPKWRRAESRSKCDKSLKHDRSVQLVQIDIPDKLRYENTVKNAKLDVAIKPLDKFVNQMDTADFVKLNLNIGKYLNSVCLNVSLSDTLLNLFRDINFDSCTLCVCTNNNNIKGIDFGTYLCMDALNTSENGLVVNNNQANVVSSSCHSSHYVSCTCGFSSVVNRAMSAKSSTAVRLSRLVRVVQALKMDAHDQNMTVPYYNIVALLNRLTQAEYQSRQLMIVDSTSFNGLFAEDYSDILMLNQPHYLLWSILQDNAKFSLNSALITRKFLNNILLRDGYAWKKSLVPAGPASAELDKKSAKKNTINAVDEKVVLKMEQKLQDAVNLNVMDLFDLKYSQPMLCTHEQYEIFYTNNHVHDVHEDIWPPNLKPKLKSYLKHKLDLATLSQFDENSVCRNVIKRLDKNVQLKESKFLLHKWLYSNREIKSNLEMTKSLKLIQPLLEETVQKKHTTSRMWESFQGPLTWQHFCRLALTGAQQKQVQAPSGSSVPSSLNQNQLNNYEPEPIPALLVSSVDKDWLTISPYAVKFWEKLNLEPYSKQKNIAYLIMMPEIDVLNDKDSLFEYETTKQSVSNYFKELNSTYELCRLGLHRPALRIAPDQGFVKVQNHPGIKVDEWFTKIQVNKQARQLGKRLKHYAKTFRLLANKITQGAKSTISNTIQGSFFPSETLNNQVKNTTSFQTSQSGTPVVSQINLDRSIYEELKISKQETVTVQPVPQPPASSTLSNLLSQPIGSEFSDPGNPLTLDFSSSQSQAQILNFKEDTKETTTFLDSHTQQCQSQKQILNSIASSSNLTPTSQLTQHLKSAPSLFVYIIDPFDFKLYNPAESETNKKAKSEQDSDIDDEFADPNDESLAESDLRRLRQLGLLKAYLEFHNNLPDLFKFSTQFQIVPLSLCVDLQTQSTSMYIQSLLMSKKIALSNYSSYYSAGFGTGWSDMDSDFRQSLLKSQAFNSFGLSKRYFMSPAHAMYLNLHQRQAYPNRPKILTSFGPAASEEKFLHDTLLHHAQNYTHFSDLQKIQFYSPLFVLAPSTIATSAVSLAASSLFFKNGTTNAHHNSNCSGDGISQMPNFVHLNFSNSSYGFLNAHHTYNYNLADLVSQQQQLLPGSNLASSAHAAHLTCQSYEQQSNVLYVGYCLSEDQRFLLATCTDENGELIESTSINIEVDERFKRKENHSRRIGLRKLWEFIIAVISQTSKPWRLVVGRLGRLGHSELRGWACLLSKKNLQRVSHQLKESCEACNTFGNLESPFILSACLISMEKSDLVCVYPESCSKEDKIAAAALTGQQSQLSSHMTQAHGVSCTHILTFPASAVIQTQSSSMGGASLKDLDPLGKSALGAMPMEDDIFGDFFNLEEDDQLLVENMNDKGLNESGAAMDAEQGNVKERCESLLNQEESAHLDQQPLAVGYYVSTAKCGPLPKWLRGELPLDFNSHTFKATLHIHNRYALENDELNMKTDNSHKLDSPITYEALRYVLERYNALSWLNIDPLMQDRKSCLPIHHSILLQMYYAFKNYI